MADSMSDTAEIPTGPEPPKEEEETKDRDDTQEAQAPYFYYRDHSHLPDPDPSKPVTIPGRIPTFPAKLFAILSRPELADIISWMPHGRSWKVHKPREFEVKVIPSYFDHAKFSSFIRQANGWGFKRVCTKGADRNSHYHELFLRGMPHLIKFMKRPITGSKVPSAPLHSKGKNCDPDFYRISQEHPLPEFTPKTMHPLDESNFLNSGANNRMAGSACERSCEQRSLSPQLLPPPLVTSSSNNAEQIAKLQAFFVPQDTVSKEMNQVLEQQTQSTMNNQAFLLPRVAESSNQGHNSFVMQVQPLSINNVCPVRQQEKELDPLTILLNDVYEEETNIDDPVIQSLLSNPSVPPPSSLNQNSYTSPPSTPPMAPKDVFSSHAMYHASQAPQMVQIVSPVEDKQIMELPEPAYVNFGQSHQLSDDLVFDDPFVGAYGAHDFW